MVTDSKKRKIAVANIKDRIIHRLIYEHLVPIFDKTFIFDVWSCRKNKGLTMAIERTQKLFRGQKNFYCWRADIEKFFDNIDHKLLIKLLFRKVTGSRTRRLLKMIINSYTSNKGGQGIPIGNLTSQIFANIYLNELDRFVKNNLKIKYYLRYGDDFIVLDSDLENLQNLRYTISNFCQKGLIIKIKRNDTLLKYQEGWNFWEQKYILRGKISRKKI